jgi:hypothetical protein
MATYISLMLRPTRRLDKLLVPDTQTREVRRCPSAILTCKRDLEWRMQQNCDAESPIPITPASSTNSSRSTVQGSSSAHQRKEVGTFIGSLFQFPQILVI